MSLRADVRAVLGTFQLDAHVAVEPGAPVLLAGPNGAGKTTLLRAIAGLQSCEGSVMIDGTELRTAPPHTRGIGLVTQHGHLFDVMSVLDNVAYGVRCHGASKAVARTTARDLLATFGVEDLAAREARTLSGGESRLVALARAIAIRPRVLLLDEPFAALDASARPRVRRALQTALGSHDGMTVICAHDPVDVLTLASDVVVLETGRVVQTGTPDDLKVHPSTAYVADLIGVNLLHGELRHGHIVLEGGGRLIVASDVADGPVDVVIHPRIVSLHVELPSGSPRNLIVGTIGHIDDVGDRLRVRVDGTPSLVAEVTPAAVRELGLHRGSRVYASLKATEIVVRPA